MKIITATIIDATHLELAQPLSLKPGETVSISIIGDTKEEILWREATKSNLLNAYANEDSIYDDL